MKYATVFSVAGLSLVAACAGHTGKSVGADPWLRTRGASNCARPACLFAVVVDSIDNPVGGIDVEVVGSGIQATSTVRGRIAVQGIAIGPHALRVTAGGKQILSEPIGFGFTFQALTIQLHGDSVRIKS
ncbi:MAG TPA: hypothetical protein VGI92_06655 [Gemmatimonadales bacterium]|jgi:hypothetical protein